MRRATFIAAGLLLVSQCAAIEYDLPQTNDAEIEAARTAIEGASLPERSGIAEDILIDRADRAAQRLRAAVPALCEAISTENCPSFALRLASGDFAMAGIDQQNNVWVTLKLLGYLGSEDEVAAVIAHEISHRLNDDGKALPAIRTHQTMRYALGGSSPASAAMRHSGESRYAITRELSADYLAAFLLSRAGYDLGAAERIWIVLAKTSSSRGEIATHPLSPERLAAWRKIAAEIEANPGAMPRVAAD